MGRDGQPEAQKGKQLIRDNSIDIRRYGLGRSGESLELIKFTPTVGSKPTFSDYLNIFLESKTLSSMTYNFFIFVWCGVSNGLHSMNIVSCFLIDGVVGEGRRKRIGTTRR